MGSRCCGRQRRPLAAQLLQVLAIALVLVQLAAEGMAAVADKEQGEGQQAHRHLGHKHRKRDPESVIFNKSTVPYCNYPNGLEIPPLNAGLAERIPGLRLLQVQVVARHGSRTPYKVYSPTCWDGSVRQLGQGCVCVDWGSGWGGRCQMSGSRFTNRYGFTDWNCNVTEMSLPDAADEEEGKIGRPAPWIFRKVCGRDM